MPSVPTFDPHIFAGHKNFAKILAKGGLDARDIGSTRNGNRRGQIIVRQGRAFDSVPQFVTNPLHLRQVLLEIGFTYCRTRRGRGIAVPDGVKDDYKLLANLTVEISLHFKVLAEGPSAYWQAMARSVNAVSNAGGYVAVCAAVAYRAWLLRWHDADIAGEMNLTKGQVTAYLARMRRVARSLGFPCVMRPTNPHPRIDADAVVEMWKSEKRITRIARALGCSVDTAKNALSDRGLIGWSALLANRPDAAVENRGRATQENVAMYWSLGWSTKEIVQELGCSHSVYRRILKSLTKFIRHGGSGPARFGRKQHAGH
jgi:hypothetical protein